MKKLVCLLLFLFLVGSLLSMNTNASAPEKINLSFLQEVSNDPDLISVLVELKSDAVVAFAWKSFQQRNHFQTNSFVYGSNDEDKYRSKVTAEQDHWVKELSHQGISFHERYRCTDVMNSVALDVKGTDLSKLSQLPSINQIFDERGKFYPNRAIAVETTGAKNAWAGSGLNTGITGKGVLVGVLDTGLDKTHMNTGEFKSRVEGGYDFADGDADFDDTQIGHGTHVAGIIGGKGKKETQQGMAYDAKFRIYKVFSSKGGGGKGIGEAIDKSVKEKCNVINMSLGSEGEPNNTAKKNPYYGNIIENASKAGTMVVASAGNSGSRGKNQPFSAGSPGIVEDTFCIAAANDRPVVTFSVKSGKNKASKNIKMNQAAGTPLFDDTFSNLEIVLCGYGKVDEFEEDVTDKIALIKRGPKEDAENGIKPLTFKEKMENAMAKGAKAVLLYNHTPIEIISPAVSLDGFTGEEKLIPVSMMSLGDGEWLLSILTEPYEIEFTTKLWTNVASFSSMGPTPDGFFKPEIIAPGTSIVSTYLKGKYIPMSGTSMSSPVVTGLVALLKQAYPKWNTDQIKSALMNTSDLLINPDNNLPITFLLQGAGEARIDRALVTPALISPRALIVQKNMIQPGDRKPEDPIKFTLESNSTKTETFPLGYKIFKFPDEESHIDVSIDKESVVVPVNGNAAFSVRFDVDWGSMTKNSYEGIIQVGKDLHIPFVIFRSTVLKVPDAISGISIEPKEVTLTKENPKIDIKINFSIYSGTLLKNDEEEGDDNYSNFATVDLLITSDWGESWGKIATFSNYSLGDYEYHWDGKTPDGKFFLPKGVYTVQFQSLGRSTTPDFIGKGEDIPRFTVTESSAPDPLPALLSCQKIIRVNDIFRVFLILPTIQDCTGIEFDLTYDPGSLMGMEIKDGGFLSSDGVNVDFSQEMDDLKGFIHVKILRDENKGISGANAKMVEFDFKAIGEGVLEFSIQSCQIFFVDDTLGSIDLTYPDIRISKSSEFLLADVNEDKIVDQADWVIFMDTFSAKINEKKYQSKCDFNQDQVINFEDFIFLSSEFGKTITE